MTSVESESTDLLESQAEDAARFLPVLSCPVFQFVRSAQAQHGLRHSDHARYRYARGAQLITSRAAFHCPQGAAHRALRLGAIALHLQNYKFIFVKECIALRA